jgi:hypothetical protein
MKKFITTTLLTFSLLFSSTVFATEPQPARRVSVKCISTNANIVKFCRNKAHELVRERHRQDLVPPPVEEPRPAWLTVVLYTGAVSLGVATGIGADVAGHQLTDGQVRPGEVVIVGLAFGAVAAAVTAILDE